MLVAAIGVLRVIGDGRQESLEQFVAHLHLDPQNQVIHTIISRVTGIDRMHLRTIEAGTFFYAILHIIEGVGLLLDRDWAGYLVIIATSSLVPFELYEISRKLSPLRIILLLLNLAVVSYLVATLRAEFRAPGPCYLLNCQPSFCNQYLPIKISQMFAKRAIHVEKLTGVFVVERIEPTLDSGSHGHVSTRPSKFLKLISSAG